MVTQLNELLGKILDNETDNAGKLRAQNRLVLFKTAQQKRILGSSLVAQCTK